MTIFTDDSNQALISDGGEQSVHELELVVADEWCLSTPNIGGCVSFNSSAIIYA